MKLPQTSPLTVEALLQTRQLPVGRLAIDRRSAVFEYAPGFIASGHSLHPLWPVTNAPVAARNPRAFRGLHGVFADSLPDAWGRELQRRRCARAGIAFDKLTPLEQLALVGTRGMGALLYSPAVPDDGEDPVDLDVLADEANAVIEGRDSAVLPQLERLGGSSGGARPKVLVALNDAGHVRAGAQAVPPGYEAWIVKFPSSRDVPDIGPLEAAYAATARDAGVRVPDYRLIQTRRGPGYFATKRFDRGPNDVRHHMVSVAGVLDIDWEEPAIDYDNLLRLVRAVTRNQQEVEEMFRRMVFNVVAHNRDDHTKQHTFLYDDRAKRWFLAPAYDLRLSNGPNGEHYLAVSGEARDVGAAAIRRVADSQDIGPKRLSAIVGEVIRGAERFDVHARVFGVTASTRAAVVAATAAGAERLSELTKSRS